MRSGLGNKMVLRFDIKFTLAIKAVAIVLMIIHHLFLERPKALNLNLEEFVFWKIAIVGKICVSLFLILSGIGLEMTAGQGDNLLSKSLGRVVKIWLQYAFVVLLSTIVGAVFFPGQFFELVPISGDGLNKFLLTLSGLQFLLYYPGFNASWWYITVTIVLYLLFPILHRLLDKLGFKLVVVMFLASFAEALRVNILNVAVLLNYAFPFVVGMYLAKGENIQIIHESIKKNAATLLACHVFLVGLVIARSRPELNLTMANKMDFLIGISLITLAYHHYTTLRSPDMIPESVLWIGKVSGKIYLTHAFITNFYVRDALFFLRSPSLIFLVALTISIAVAAFLEHAQQVAGVDSAIESISKNAGELCRRHQGVSVWNSDRNELA